MNQKLENLINLLCKQNLSYYEFISKANEIEELSSIFDVRDLAMWQILGLDIKRNGSNEIELNTRKRNIDDQTFCVVDIETSGGINSGQIIEIGAIKIKDGIELDRFETLVYAINIPENISALTGIRVDDLKGAPSLASVLEKFRLFLAECVFVAHNVKFDYGFINASFEKFGLGTMLNRKICTIDLARRTIPSLKYGLGALKEVLGIQNTHHRAMNDAIAAAEIFKAAVKSTPSSVRYTEDLIEFSKTANTVKRPTVSAQTVINFEE